MLTKLLIFETRPFGVQVQTSLKKAITAPAANCLAYKSCLLIFLNATSTMNKIVAAKFSPLKRPKVIARRPG